MKLLISAKWIDNFVDESVRAAFPTVDFIYRADREALLIEAADAEVIFGPVDDQLFRAAKRVKLIQSTSAGVEWMHKVPALADSDVAVANVRGAHATTIAEHTFGMLIFLTRGFDSLYQSQLRKVWQRPVEKRGVGLVGMIMGIIGLGQIGRAIGERAAAFGMDVIAVDAHAVPQPDFVSDLRLLDGLDDLVGRADVVVVATPITPETRGMLSPARLRQMKSSAYLLVMSRGGIIDEPTLAEMLHSGDLAGAGLDVTAVEPLPAESDLWDAPNIIITPHSSPTSRQTHANVRAMLKENLRRYLAGEELVNLVDKKLGY